MVPKHAILTDNEKQEILNQYKITLRQLPRILLNDPAVMSLGGKIGDVVKIIRKSSNAGESFYYRVVVKG